MLTSLERQQKVAEVEQLFRPYQKETYQILLDEKRWLLYLDMGLGKTLVSLAAMMKLEAFPAIIVAPKNALYVWAGELEKWFGETAVTVYVGKPKKRAEQWKEFMTKGHKVIITNYALVGELTQRFAIYTPTGTPTNKAAWKIGAIICDEIHTSGLFNHRSQTYGIIKKASKEVPFVVLLTGTPYRQGVIDFYGPLSIIRPGAFDSYWKFVNRHCVVLQSRFGKDIERNPRDVFGFRTMLRKHATILKKTDVAQDLPGKQRQAIMVDMDEDQWKLYSELTENLFAEVPNSKEFIIVQGKLPLMIKQRQILACPQEIGLQTRGAAIDTILEMSDAHFVNNEPIVVFTPFKTAIPWLAKAFREEYPGVKQFIMQGGMTAEAFRDAWQGFQNGKGAAVLFVVIKSGASFQATRARSCFFLGYEWDFNLNEQAEDRLNRIGQVNFVNCYYIMHRGTIDEAVAERLDDKKWSSDWVLSEKEAFEIMLDKVRGKLKRQR